MRYLLGALFACLLAWLSLGAGAQEKPAAAVHPKTAIFAGGCFWCMQPSFDRAAGVIKTEAGYSGGHVVKPTYEQVSRGDTGHMEVIAVTYDPAKITYQQLLDIYWTTIDPIDAEGQFCDRGSQYASAIFYADEAEHKMALESKMLLEADDERFGGKPVVTKILPAAPFYPAEEYHQSYYKKNSLRYQFYRSRCGRDERLEKVWGDKAAKH